MAATTGNNLTISNGSSSEDEDLQKLKEAVWDTATATPKDGEKNVKSRRLVVSEHKHDGNELQVTPEFRSHVAKKLEHILDSCITEMQGDTSHALSQCGDDDDDDDDDGGGFRLFATSDPGQRADEPSLPVKRCIPSSSDSDSEMDARLKEAAVPLSDFLPLSSLPFASTTTSCSVEINSKEKEGETPLPKKKKKKKKKTKRKAHRDESEESVCPEQKPEGEGNPIPKKKKKQILEEREHVSVSAGTSDEAQNKSENRLQLKSKKKKKRKAVI